MPKKDIRAIIEEEGSRFVPNGFSAISDKLGLSATPIEAKISEEGDRFVPNKPVNPPLPHVYPEAMRSQRMVSYVAGAIVLFGLIASVPALITATSGSVVEPSLATVSMKSNNVNSAYSETAAASTYELDLSYLIDSSGLSSLANCYANSDVSKAAIYVLGKSTASQSDPASLAGNIIYAAGENNLISTTRSVSISIRSGSEAYTNYLSNSISEKVKSAIDGTGLSIAVTINASTVDSLSAEDTELQEKALALKANVDDLLSDSDELFYPGDKDIDWYVSLFNKDEDYANRIADSLAYFSETIQSSDSKSAFHQDLEYIANLYEKRGEDIEDWIDKTRDCLDDMEETYAEGKDDSWEEDSAYPAYDSNRDIDIESYSPVWWDNSFTDKNTSDLKKIGVNWWQDQGRPDGPGYGPDKPFAITLEKINQTLDGYYRLKDAHLMNSIWFSLAFDLVKEDKIYDNDGNNEKRDYDDYGHGKDDWDDYWDDFIDSHKDHRN